MKAKHNRNVDEYGQEREREFSFVVDVLYKRNRDAWFFLERKKEQMTRDKDTEKRRDMYEHARTKQLSTSIE